MLKEEESPKGAFPLKTKTEIGNRESGIIYCPICSNKNVVKDGHNTNGEQKYECKICGKKFSGNENNCKKKKHLMKEAKNMLWSGIARKDIVARLGICYRTLERWLNDK